MTNIRKEALPHKVGIADIANTETKRVTMLLTENINVLKTQLEAAQAAIIELQRRRNNG